MIHTINAISSNILVLAIAWAFFAWGMSKFVK